MEGYTFGSFSVTALTISEEVLKQEETQREPISVLYIIPVSIPPINSSPDFLLSPLLDLKPALLLVFDNLEAGLTILSTFDILEPDPFILSDYVLLGSDPTTKGVFFVRLLFFFRYTFLFFQVLFFPASAISLFNNKVTFL